MSDNVSPENIVVNVASGDLKRKRNGTEKRERLWDRFFLPPFREMYKNLSVKALRKPEGSLIE